MTEYTHGSYDLLGIQIDAAINGGNSGGPVFNRKGQCVGIAFQALSGSDVENVRCATLLLLLQRINVLCRALLLCDAAEETIWLMRAVTDSDNSLLNCPAQVGYVIPTAVVNHFLTDYLRNGSFTGFPALGVQWQRMESETLRRAYKMAAKQKGE